MRHGDSNKMPYDCDMCQEVFNHFEGFKKHWMRHGDSNKMPYDCDMCQKVFSHFEGFKSIG